MRLLHEKEGKGVYKIMNENSQSVIMTLDKICNHIDNVQRNCRRLAEALILKGEYDFGKTLIAHAYIHDNSKFFGLEFEYLNQKDNKEMLFCAVRQHQSVNPHHPEYWGGIHNMPRIYIAEMVADWLARSQEFGSSLMEWVKEKATEKFGFTMEDRVGKEIKFFIDILCENSFV